MLYSMYTIAAFEGMIFTIEKMLEDILYQQVKNIQSEIRTHDAFIDTIIRRGNERRLNLITIGM